MKTQNEIAKQRLFDPQGMNADNFKLFPGTDREISADRISEEVNKVVAQLAAGETDPIDLSADDQ